MAAFLGLTLAIQPWLVRAENIVDLQNPTKISMGSISQLNEIDSDEQISIIKQSVLEYAMERNARIAATSWTQDNGALNEEVMMFSNLQLEKLTPQIYTNRFGMTGTRLVEMSPAELTGDNAVQSCARAGARRQRLKLTVQPVETDNVTVINLVRDSARLIQQDMVRATQLGALQNASLMLQQNVGTSASPEYLKYMVLSEPVTSDLEVTIRVSGRPVKKMLERFWVAKSARGPIRLELQMLAQSSAGIQFSQSESIVVKSGRSDTLSQKAWLGLPKSAITQLSEWSEKTIAALGASVRCESGSAVSIAQRLGGGMLMAGRDVGFFQGQKFLIMPSSELAQRQGLEKTLGHIGLAQITSLNPHTANIGLYAGSMPESYDNMIAIPLAALAP
jgi:hypothetical protein